MLLNPAFKISGEDTHAFHHVLALLEQSGPTEENALLMRRVKECIRENNGGKGRIMDMPRAADDEQAATMIGEYIGKIRHPALRELLYPFAAAVGERTSGRESALKRLAAARLALGMAEDGREAVRVSRILVDENSLISPAKLLIHSAFSMFIVVAVIFFSL